jgi:hypothetical protein
MPKSLCRKWRTSMTFGTVCGWILGTQVSTARQDLDRQEGTLRVAGIAPERIYLDKESGATTDLPSLTRCWRTHV